MPNLVDRSTPIRVLLVEDNRGDFVLTRNMLSEFGADQFRLDWISDYDGAVEALKDNSHDVYLIDYRLGAANGIDLLRRAHEVGCTAPIIMLTGQDGSDADRAAMELGAADYLVKGQIVPALLARSIRYAIARQQHIKEQVEANEQLRKNNQKLSELYKMAHQFVDNASHEFRTPLTVIKEFASILEEGLAGDINDEQRDYLNIITSRVDDLGLMVSDMLDISKLEAGLLGVTRREHRVEEIIENTRTTLERKAAAKNVALDFEIDDDLPSVYCDMEKIGRVIINLVVNALKFSNDGGHTTLSARHRVDAAEVVFEVTDDGPGIADENLQAIFKRFMQVGADVRASTKGFGLGLNIAKELVQLNFGDMDVKSELGKGSTFAFTVPTFDEPKIIERFLARAKHIRNDSSFVSLITARIESTTNADVPVDVERFLHQQLRHSDLLFCTRPGSWIMAAATDPQDLDQLVSCMDEAWEKANRNRPGLKLPAIDFKVVGTWRVLEQADELIRRFEAGRGAGTASSTRARPPK